jgi:hypothetical protein
MILALPERITKERRRQKQAPVRLALLAQSTPALGRAGPTRAGLRLTFPATLASRWMPGLFPDKAG